MEGQLNWARVSDSRLKRTRNSSLAGPLPAKQFDRHGALEAYLRGKINLAHAAGRQLALQPKIAAEDSPFVRRASSRGQCAYA